MTLSESFTSKKFFQRHAQDFNFELNEEELIKALSVDSLPHHLGGHPMTSVRCIGITQTTSLPTNRTFDESN